jgi:hypothetical protein
MGAWGFRIFENDDAADFVAEFEQEGIIPLSRALNEVCESEYIEAPEGSVALAAAAIVAAATGIQDVLPDEVEAALKSVNSWQAISGLKGQARRAVECVASSKSELIELWNDAAPEDLAGFRIEMESLQNALRA